MINPRVRCMCAIGLSGQMGLNGQLPWEGCRDQPFVDDVARFFEMTRGHVLLAGARTIGSVPTFALADRTVGILRRDQSPEEALAPYEGRIVYIGGGPAVWDVYAPLIAHWDITRLPYDGPADTWFNPEWLLAGGTHQRRVATG
jgi:dihydromethanopterin reductase